MESGTWQGFMVAQAAAIRRQRKNQARAQSQRLRSRTGALRPEPGAGNKSALADAASSNFLLKKPAACYTVVWYEYGNGQGYVHA